MKRHARILRTVVAVSIAALAPHAGASPASDTARPKPRYGNLKPASNPAAGKNYGERMAQPQQAKAAPAKTQTQTNASRPRLYKAQSRNDFHRTNGAPRSGR